MPLRSVKTTEPWLVYAVFYVTLTVIRGQCVLDLSAVPGDLKTQDSIYAEGSSLCTWTVRSGQNYVAQVTFGANLNPNASCDETNGVTLRNGGAPTPVGIICGNYTSTLQSSQQELVITYDPQAVSGVWNFTMLYTAVPLDNVRADVHVVSSSLATLKTPVVAADGASEIYGSHWVLRSKTATDRIYYNIDVPENIPCNEANVTIIDLSLPGRQVLEWCPGDPVKSFISRANRLSLSVDYQGSRSVAISYMYVGESICGTHTVEATAEAQYLMTPGYPNPFPKFTDCLWLVQFTNRSKRGLYLEIEDTDMDCSTDSLVVITGDTLFKPVIDTICDGANTTFIQYYFELYVTFKSSDMNDVRVKKGIKIKYYKGPAEPCGGQLTATSTVESIQSPGFPHYYPSSIVCEWKVTAATPGSYVKLEFVTVDLSSWDEVWVYDGPTRIARVKDSSSGIVATGVERTLRVLFRSDSSVGKPGFNMTYQETEEPASLNLELEGDLSRDRSATLVSPRYPDDVVKEVTATWTLKGALSDLEVILTFTDVDLGPPEDCDNNYIKIYNGNSTSTQVSTLCGQEKGIYMSTDRILTVVMTTDSSVARRGFKANYFSEYNTRTGGCDGTVDNLDAFTSHTLDTINYPYGYPNMADCTYNISVLYSNSDYATYFIRVQFLNVDMTPTPDENCTKDYIELFDGATTSAKSFGRFCRNTTQVFDTSGRHLLVKFRSDANLGSKGAVLAYSEKSIKESATPNLALWIILGIVGGVIVIVVIAAFIVYKRKSSQANISQETVNMSTKI